MSSKPYRVGQWLPSDRNVIEKWYKNLKKEVAKEYKDKIELITALHPICEDNEKAYLPQNELQPHEVTALEAKELGLHPPVQALMDKILSDPEINMFFHQMFLQQKDLPDTSEGTMIWSWQMMILYINYIMTTAPKYNKTGLVGFPINVILNWPMATTAGFAAFLNDKVNLLFKNILNYWGEYLKSDASTSVLNDDPQSGWFGTDAMADMPNFANEFVCDPNAPHYGFTSWDNFFVRLYKEGVRPVAEPDNQYIVANACESAPFQIYTNVKRRDYF